MAHEERAHATLGASGAAKWMNCPGSVAAEAAVPRSPGGEDNAASREGTAAHELFEYCLVKGVAAYNYPLSNVTVGKHLIEVTDEMREGVQVAVDAVMSASMQFAREEIIDDMPELRVEQKISLASLNPPVDMFGTVDVELYFPQALHLSIIDLKYGKGIYVPAANNAQLKYYALGAILKLKEEGRVVETVTCTIVQPRNHEGDPVRSAHYTYAEIMQFAEEVIEAAHAAQKPDAPRKTGSWCRWCKAKATCPAQYELAQETASLSFDVIEDTPLPAPPDPTTLTSTQIERVLEMAPIVTDWLKSVEVHAKMRASHGDLPGWKVVESGRGHRKWTDADKVIEILGDDVVEKRVKTVAQVEKLLGKRNMNKVANYVVKGPGATLLVPEADSRPALSSGIESFDVITDTEES